ncbi:hypothetical protein [Geopseudomonas aromaticivorans]
MRATLDIKTLHQALPEDADLDDFAALDASSPLARLFTAVAQTMNDHPDLQAISGMQPAECYPDIEFPDPQSEISIEVVLCGATDDIPAVLDHDFGGQSPLGAFATSSGLFDTSAWLADRFRVLVSCSEDDLRQHILDERSQEMDPYSGQHDHHYLFSYLNTLTHELRHAVDFIEHGNGLTPSQVDDFNDTGDFEFGLRDVANGRGIRDDVDAELDDDEADNLMEDRVEAAGREWLSWALAKIEPGLFEEALAACTPTDLQVGMTPDCHP